MSFLAWFSTGLIVALYFALSAILWHRERYQFVCRRLAELTEELRVLSAERDRLEEVVEDDGDWWKVR